MFVFLSTSHWNKIISEQPFLEYQTICSCYDFKYMNSSLQSSSMLNTAEYYSRSILLSFYKFFKNFLSSSFLALRLYDTVKIESNTWSVRNSITIMLGIFCPFLHKNMSHLHQTPLQCFTAGDEKLKINLWLFIFNKICIWSNAICFIS